MREITDHMVIPGDRLAVSITADDTPGHGGANHLYTVAGMTLTENPSWVGGMITQIPILFQNGLLSEAVNGLTQEALLAIVIDRLRSFQAGNFACRENALALTKIEEALHWLHARTRKRIDRGVEGKLVP